ncbi:MAG TPA: helix-turn-helix transcriptional regulator [Thermoanaerobaculales bacterium]|nr:helix-turn-helix transcriptional regulator [Thermoanaerobaculales bacterium]HQL30759.1 helix-turn-helix transcriptional regulator [Thermoanaerobaculales bacterium]HQP44592.1 helix-turn-helix transcriptional regulator [Thermoanaerobaculales bacterium]
MGDRRSVSSRESLPSRLPRLERRRPRSFTEWRTLRRWRKLPPWEVEVPGYLLREARVSSGLSQQLLADRLGITQQAVSSVERWGSNPTVDLMRRWLAACGHRLELRVVPLTPTSAVDSPYHR